MRFAHESDGVVGNLSVVNPQPDRYPRKSLVIIRLQQHW
jgi:hypothetical protein